MQNEQGLLVVISGPSGVGKTTIVHRVKEAFEATFSVSATTRPKSKNETEGIDYFFISNDRFDEMIQENEFLEFAEVFGCHRYGTPRGAVEDALQDSQIMLLDIDVQGGIQVHQNMPESIRIFILPPSEQELYRRLEERGREDSLSIERRYSEAKQEIATATKSGAYSFFIVNDDLDLAVAETIAVINEHKSSTAPTS